MTDALHAHRVPGVRQQAGFIICYGPQRAITQPWNDSSAASAHFSATESAVCLLAAAKASARSTLILSSSDRLNKSSAYQVETSRKCVCANKLPALCCWTFIHQNYLSPVESSSRTASGVCRFLKNSVCVRSREPLGVQRL